MQIYTSYYGAMRRLPANITPISISVSKPKFFEGLVYPPLAPKWNMVSDYKADGDTQKYTERFKREILSVLNPNQVAAELAALAQNDSVCLLCYEKTGDFCHRNIVAEWFRRAGINCTEFQQ